MVTVIEGGRPNGDDLVVGDHNGNPLSRAKAQGQPITNVLRLDQDFGVIPQPQILFRKDGENLIFDLCVLAGPISPIVGLNAVPVKLMEVGRITPDELRAAVAKEMKPPEIA